MWPRMGQTSTGATASKLALTPALAVSAILLVAPVRGAAQDRWHTPFALSQWRSGHTATLLANGDVLIVGGYPYLGIGSPEPHATTEILDVSRQYPMPGPSLAEGRVHHTATRLFDGRVLVCGGWSSPGSPFETCEIFDPELRAWSPGPSMNWPRVFHTATLLTDGRVLVAGGHDGASSLAAAEIMDADGTGWTSVGSMAAARHHHTATLLASGTVVVVGGSDVEPAKMPEDMQDPTPLSECEQYLPATDTWSPLPPLPGGYQRANHAAMALDDGRVLVLGGWDGTATVSTVAAYLPGSPAWDTSIPAMTVNREDHAALLLPSGEMIVIGGRDWDCTFGCSYGLYSYWELFDTASDTWSSFSEGFAARAELTATLLADGSALAVGGHDYNGRQVQRFISRNHQWSDSEPIPEPVYMGHTQGFTLIPDGRLLQCGGNLTGTSVKTSACWTYDYVSGSWSAFPSLNLPRSYHTTTLLPDGRVLVTGGDAVGGTTAELYESGSWRMVAPMHSARGSHRAVVLPDGSVLVVAGEYPNLGTTEVYHPETDEWQVVGSLSLQHWKFTLIRLADGRVLAVGDGHSSTATREGELFDPQTLQWQTTDPMRIPRWAPSATLLHDGRVLVHGGDTYSELCELFDPATATWAPTGSLSDPRSGTTSSSALLADGRVLVAGRGGAGTSAEIYNPATQSWSQDLGFSAGSQNRVVDALMVDGSVVLVGTTTDRNPVFLPSTYVPTSQRPVIDADTTSASLTPGNPFVVSVTGIAGTTEASDGTTQNSASNLPLVSLRTIDNGRRHVLTGAAATWSAATDTMTLEFSQLPDDLDVGWHYLTVSTNGVPSISKLVNSSCGAPQIISHPSSITAAAGSQASFSIADVYARWHQWQYCDTGDCTDAGEWMDIVGAIGPTYTTEVISAPDSGRQFRVEARGSCYDPQQSCSTHPQGCALSEPATLTVEDEIAPTADVVSPFGGEYWLLSDPDSPANTELITWSMSDNVRICRVRASLHHSNDGGSTWVETSGGGLPMTSGPGGTCAFPGESTSSTTYTVPTAPPSGVSGSLYKIRVQVWDHAGLTTVAESANPFYIVRPNSGTVQTLILTRPQTMEALFGVADADRLNTKLYELAGHPLVQGFVVDLDPTAAGALLDAWSSGAISANDALFGAGGLHEYLLQELLPVYSGARYLVLIGDDRVIPFARMPDDAVLLPESTYTDGSDLRSNGSTVGQALSADLYLSDDPLAVLDPIAPQDLDPSGPFQIAVYLPDLAVGRLVEQPDEIITTIATFISQDGVLDMTSTSHQTLISGYDFLIDSATVIREQWKARLGVSTPDSSIAPVNGALISTDWGLPTVADRRTELRTHLAGYGGDRYAVASLNGHATHYEEGVPGTDPFDIQGLVAADMYGPDGCATPSSGALDFSGSVVYSVGCHGGLPVPGSCATDADHSLDLPQTMLSRGVVTYLANTGYGWGLNQGIGYGERLVQIFTEELTVGGEVVIGDAVRATKLRYFLEAPRFDAYDLKSLMQWSLFGLPMYGVSTGIAAGKSGETDADAQGKRTEVELSGGIEVTRRLEKSAGLPDFLTRLELSFNLSADGLYSKYGASGQLLPDTPGCSDPGGCYYAVNGLVTGKTDLPLQPYLVYDSRLSGTSQHGVLWKGSSYLEEPGWTPVLGELVSNGVYGSDHGSLPRKAIIRPKGTRHIGGEDPPECRPSDLEVNTLVLTAGEATTSQSGPTFGVERTYRGIDLEVFYFNNTVDAVGNCDRQGPLLGPDPGTGRYDQVDSGTTLEWSILASDEAGVWRVVVVVNDGSVDASGYGAWTPIELVDQGAGVWGGSLDISQTSSLTYVVQAVDSRGNVSWLNYQTSRLPESGVPFDVPLVIEGLGGIFSDDFESGNTAMWSYTAN